MSTRFNSPPVLRLDAAANEIAPPFGPVDDDQRLWNDVTVNRPEGASAIRTDEASIQAEGQYSYGVEVNAANDVILPDLAGIRLYFGTWAGMRYPTLSVDLLEAPHLARRVTRIREGDIIEITGLPAQHPLGNLRLSVEAIQERITPRSWSFTFTCSAGDPWYTGYVGTDRVSSVGTLLDTLLDEDDTQFFVANEDVWINDDTHPDDFPFLIDVGGEVMEVTSITSGGLWTVVRAINSVTKSHADGTPITVVSGLVVVP